MHRRTMTMVSSLLSVGAALQLLGVAHTRAQGPPSLLSIGTCQLASGATIRDCRVAYRAFGRLNAGRTNTVLIPTWLQGRSEDWLALLGPAGYVDTSQFHVLVVDALADGHSSSPSNVGSEARAAFRDLTVADMVESQYRLVERLGIPRLHGVVGVSMGGMQAFEWAVRYPTFVGRVIPVVGSPQVPAFDRLLWTTLLSEIERGRQLHASEDSIWAQLARLEALLIQTPLASTTQGRLACSQR
jgi:homoserine O-acetyltransferase/O-succinyltransferase